MPPPPVLLTILDGWGHTAPGPDNAIWNARTPCWEALTQTAPHALLQASGPAVGLPEGQMGNSEVGHMHMGAGRVLPHIRSHIDTDIESVQLFKNPHLLSFLQKLGTGTLHLLGLLSPGGVHGHESHMMALAQCLQERGVPFVLHLILDGRDTPPQSGHQSLDRLLDIVPLQNIGTLMGRYYAMDRDKNWKRTEVAHNALMHGAGLPMDDPRQALDHAYKEGQTDEFITPYVNTTYSGCAPKDGLLVTHFRADRARQLLTSVLTRPFESFPVTSAPLTRCLGFVPYADTLSPLMDILFSLQDIPDTLGEVVARAHLPQLRIAETEKYAHVTYFFSGGREHCFPLEERCLIPSPKVATYDLCPSMSAHGIVEALMEAFSQKVYSLVVLNFANADMVGHTGNVTATIKAVETVDQCLGRLNALMQHHKGHLVVTSDHGNAECMKNITSGQPLTSHTCNPVPFLVTGVSRLKAQGALPDIAPTLLTLLGLTAPSVMTGHSLIDA